MKTKNCLLLFVIALFFMSCEGPEGPVGPQGSGTNWKIINLVANKTDWVESLDENNLRYYSCSFKLPEIDAFIYNEGTTLAYVRNGDFQQVLPYVRHLQDANSTWTKTVDYEYSTGTINFYVTNSDFAADPPSGMEFRVVLMW